MKTEHALDWGKTAAEIEADFEQMAKERDRYREALEHIARGVFNCHAVAKTALLGREETK